MIQYAYGDIHGMLDQFEELHERVKAYHDETHPDIEAKHILLGDYVDRGMKSRQTVQYIIDRQDEFVILPGNHELMMLDFFDMIPDDDLKEYGYFWGRNGGTTTVASYLSDDTENHEAFYLSNWNKANLKKWQLEIEEKYPEHITFLQGLLRTKKLSDLYYINDRIMFVHAGIRPQRGIEEQSRHDLLWGREQMFLKDIGTMMWKQQDDFDLVVHGHTPMREVSIGPKRVGLDVGGFATGNLAAGVFIDGEYTGYFIASGEPSNFSKGIKGLK